jgi:hypothetical protein
MPIPFARFALAVCGAAALSACSGPADRGPQVPTLITATPAASPSPAAAVKGVQLRLDMTTVERQHIQQQYVGCLKTHGVADLRKMYAHGPTGQDKAALAACEDRKPITPPELDPATNPHFAEEQTVYQQCMDKAGITAESSESTYDTTNDKCEKQAYGK